MRYVTVYQDDGNEKRSEALAWMLAHNRSVGIDVEVIRSPAGEVFSFPARVREYLRGHTGIVAVFDSDTVCPVEQWQAAEKLAFKGYAMVLPYDGRVMESGKERTSVAVGGAYVFNWPVYREICGGENPHMKLWGKDDEERYERVRKFMRVPRVAGVIEHFPHGQAQTDHEYIRDNIEWVERVRRSSCEEIERYTRAWK